eukprot:3090907-Rhodomonas_salina.1
MKDHALPPFSSSSPPLPLRSSPAALLLVLSSAKCPLDAVMCSPTLVTMCWRALTVETCSLRGVMMWSPLGGR